MGLFAGWLSAMVLELAEGPDHGGAGHGEIVVAALQVPHQIGSTHLPS